MAIISKLTNEYILDEKEGDHGQRWYLKGNNAFGRLLSVAVSVRPRSCRDETFSSPVGLSALGLLRSYSGPMVKEDRYI